MNIVLDRVVVLLQTGLPLPLILQGMWLPTAAYCCLSLLPGSNTYITTLTCK